MSTLFHKVSLNQFALAYKDNNVENIYNDINLSQRSTQGSAGYDFFAPFDFTLKPNETITIPTGIRCEMDENRVLMIFPRSGLGFKYRMQLNNTVGIIDSDYFYSDNEGHIFIKITNNTNEDKVIEVKKGQGFAQGLFMQYFLTDDDDASAIRNGGFGSTTK